MYKVEKVKFSNYAETWLKGFQKKREAKNKERISTWSKLGKNKLRLILFLETINNSCM